MEPKTKRQREAVAIRDTLKPITEKMKLIGYSKAFWWSATQYMSGRCVCRECGHEWKRKTDMWEIDQTSVDANMLKDIGATHKRRNRPAHCLKRDARYENTICPNCHKRVQAYPHRGGTYGTDQGYFNVLECVGDYQVIRTFEVNRAWRHGQPAEYTFEGEVCQRYVDMTKGDVACDLAKNVNGLKGMYSSWTYWRHDSELTVKQSYSYGYHGYSSEKYNFPCMYIVRSLHPLLVRGNFTSLPWCKADYMIALLDPHAATLLEAKQVALFELYGVHGGKELWPQMKICMRRGYIVKDSSMWKDTIRNLQYLHMDDHSPKYVCPADLKELHDRTQRRRNRLETEERRRQRLEAARKEEAKYSKFIAKFRGLQLEGKDLVIYPLPNVESFIEEGEAMHHCVGSNRYYEDHTVLIFSARDSAGHRLATIEYGIKSGTIRQCRGVCNSVPQRDKEIRELIAQSRKIILSTNQQKTKQYECR